MNLKSPPTTIILTLNPVNCEIVTTYNHDSIGSSLHGNLKCIALTGFGEQAFPVYMYLDHLLSKTQTTFQTPSLDTLMSFHDKNVKNLKALQPTENWNDTSIRRAIILPPSLYTIVLDKPWDSKEDLLPCTIKLIATFKDDDDLIVDVDKNEQVNEWDFALDFTAILMTLYAFMKGTL
jgi:hypothetical protein